MSDEAQKHEFLRTVIQRYGSLVLARNRAILRDPTLAEDGFQQTFVRLTRWLNAQREVPSPESVHGLVVSMAERTAIDLYRQRRRQERGTAGVAPPVQEAPTESLYVDELLERLAPRERLIVEMSVFHGMTADEIADRLGLQPGTVRVAKSRAIKKMRSFLADVTVQGGRGDE